MKAIDNEYSPVALFRTQHTDLYGFSTASTEFETGEATPSLPIATQGKTHLTVHVRFVVTIVFAV